MGAVENFNPAHDEKGRFAEHGVMSSPMSSSSLDDTQHKYQHADGTWDKDRVKNVHEPILQAMFNGVPKAEGPMTVYMTGGGYGSGKSTLLNTFPQLVGFPPPGTAVRSDPDAIKSRIPEYANRTDPGIASKVHEESSYLSKQAVARAILNNNNVVYDTSGDTREDLLEKKVAYMRKLGAGRIEANYAYPGSVEEGQRRADARAKNSDGGRRKVPPALLEANHAQVAKCWLHMAEKGAFDKLTLWSTSGPMGSPPTMIAEATGGKITVHNEAEFAHFKGSANGR